MLHGSLLTAAVLAASATATVPTTLPALSVGLGTPRGVAVDRQGRVYIAAEELGRVFRLDPSGSLTIVASGLAAPCGLALGAGSVFVSECEGRGVSRIDIATGSVFRFAGTADPSPEDGGQPDGDGGPALRARLKSPAGLAVGANGDLWIADRGDHRVRRVAAATGVISTVAGDGIAGDRGDTGPAANARLDTPEGVATDSAGNVFIADRGNQRVRRIDPAGVISTVAGNGRPGVSGDGGPASRAELNDPTSVAVDAAGGLFVADRGNGRVRRITASGTIRTVLEGLQAPQAVAVGSRGAVFVAEAATRRIVRATPGAAPLVVAGDGGVGYCGDGGPASAAFLRRPEGLAVDATGNVYVADTGNNRIRKIDATTGSIVTVAGNGSAGYGGDGGPAARAALDRPRAVVLDRAGNLFIADAGNGRVRKVDLRGTITTVAGNGVKGYGGDGGPATAASLDEPSGVAVDAGGNVIVADERNRLVRRIDGVTGSIAIVAGVAPRRSLATGDATTSVALTEPSDVAVDATGAIWIADQGAHRIRRVAEGRIATVAGNGLDGGTGDGGPAAEASLGRALRLAVDAGGNVWVADMTNYRVRRVDASTSVIRTVAGKGELGAYLAGGPALSASLTPLGVALAPANLFYVSDLRGHVYRIDSRGWLTTVAGGGFGF